MEPCLVIRWPPQIRGGRCLKSETYSEAYRAYRAAANGSGEEEIRQMKIQSSSVCSGGRVRLQKKHSKLCEIEKCTEERSHLSEANWQTSL